jgi:hypothetical protein
MIINFRTRRISRDAHKLTWTPKLTIIIIKKRVHHESHYDHFYKFIKRKYDRHRYIYILYFSYYLLVVEKDTENNSPHVGCENR